MILKQFSFELRIMLKKRRRKIEEHKSGVRRRLTFVVPAQEAKSGQPLAPILGQVQLNTMEFVNSFNSQSNDFVKGFPVFVELLVNWDASYSFSFLQFPFSFFLDLFVFKVQDKSYLYIYDLLKLFRIHKLLYSNRTNTAISQIAPQLFYYLHFHNIEIVDVSRRQFYYIYYKTVFMYFQFFKYFRGLSVPDQLVKFGNDEIDNNKKRGIPIKKNKGKIRKKAKTRNKNRTNSI